jgi:archaellin
MTDRRDFLGGLTLLGAASVAGCLGDDGRSGGSGGDGRRTPTTVGPAASGSQSREPDEAGDGGSLPSALRVVSAVGTGVEARRIGTVELTVGRADWVESVDLTDLTATWAVPGDSYELAAATTDTDADGYFGIEPDRGTAADATLQTADERHRLVFDLGDDDVENDDRHRRTETDVTHFGEVVREDDVVGLRLTTAGGSTTSVRLLAPADVTEIEGTVELTID